MSLVDEKNWMIEAYAETKREQELLKAESPLLTSAAFRLLSVKQNIKRTSLLLPPSITAELMVEHLEDSLGCYLPNADVKYHYGFMVRGDDGIWRRPANYLDLGPTHVDPSMGRLLALLSSEPFGDLMQGNAFFTRNRAAVESTAKSLEHRATSFKQALVAVKPLVEISNAERVAHFARWLVNLGRDSDLVDFRLAYRADGFPGGLMDKEVGPLLNASGVLYRDGTGMAVDPNRGLAVLNRWIDEANDA